MIKSFKHKALSRFFIENDRKGLNAQHCDRINRILDRLDAACLAEDMNLPGFGFHKLIGNKNETWSIKVSGNWRITFKFVNGDAYDVNLEDYH
jgi:proteic killer suppression protein